MAGHVPSISHESRPGPEAELNARALSLTIVAFLLGALAAGGVSVRVIREVSTTDDATSLPASNIAPPKSPSDEAARSGAALLPFAVVLPFALTESEPVADIGFGYTVELVSIVDEGVNSAIEVFVSNTESDSARMAVSGVGPGWASTVTEPSQNTTILTWLGGAPLESVSLEASGAVWVPVEGVLQTTSGEDR